MKQNSSTTAQSGSKHEAIESQRGHGHDFRPGTKLDPATGQELSRTNREPKNRDVKPLTDVTREGGDPREEFEDDLRGQNASGGRANR